MFSFLSSFISKKRKKREMEKKGLIGSRKRQKANEESFSSFADRSISISIVIALLVWAVCVSLTVFPSSKRTFERLIIDQMAPHTIYADFNFTYQDFQETEKKREEAKKNVPLVYQIDQESTESCLIRAKELFQDIENRSEAKKLGRNFEYDKKNKISKIVGELSKEAIAILSLTTQNPKQNSRYINQIEIALYKGIINQKVKDSHIYGSKIRIIDPKGHEKTKLLINLPTPTEAAESIADAISKPYSLSNRQVLREALWKVTSAILRGNLVYDSKSTDIRRESAVKNVLPIMYEVRKGSIIITKSKIVTQVDLDKLAAYEKEWTERSGAKRLIRKLINSSLTCLFLIVIVAIYLNYTHNQIIKSNHRLAMIATVTILAVLLVYLTIELYHSLIPNFNSPPPRSFLLIVLPVAYAAILLSVLIGLRAALITSLFVTIVVGLQMDETFKSIIDGLVVSCVAGAAVRNSHNYKSYFLRGTMAVFLSILVVNYHQLWTSAYSIEKVIWVAGLAFTNGMLTAAFCLISLFILETIFQVSTNMSLLLLCDYNHPLLKRLQLEAPGSYHHSLMVSTLAEQAAQEIGGNPIKARVGALFHDIGKLSQPEYFIENTYEGKNKHNELHPRMSSLIILNHVKEGIDMAITFKLRKIIRDAIAQHHGTDLVYYFYKRAVEDSTEKDAPVNEQEYRYPGPLPCEKEVVLISLADACEAASRTLQKPSPAKVEALVWEIFRKRIRDGQLDSANLTFGEIAKVRKSFVKTITTMLHGRIEYPKEENDEDEDDLFKSAKNTSPAKKESTAESTEQSD